MATRSLADRLAAGPVLCAEGYLFELERRGYLKAGPFVPEVVLDHPEAIMELHREFLRAGSDVMLAFTYYAHREKLRHVGRENDLEPMNRAALRMAREVADEGDALVAGNVCNTWAYDPADPENTGRIVREMYTEQITWAKEEGVDFILSETNDYLAEALIALEVCQELGLPAVVNFASVGREKTVDGVEFVEACRMVADKGADVVGLNCTRGPSTMLPMLRKLNEAVSVPTAAVPVPYRTSPGTPTMETLITDGVQAFPLALDPHVCTRNEMGDFAVQARDLGVKFIGVCCGGAPHHVRAMAEALGRTTPSSRYSPNMALHPVLGGESETQKRHTQGWNA